MDLVLGSEGENPYDRQGSGGLTDFAACAADGGDESLVRAAEGVRMPDIASPRPRSALLLDRANGRTFNTL